MNKGAHLRSLKFQRFGFNRISQGQLSRPFVISRYKFCDKELWINELQLSSGELFCALFNTV